MNGDDSSNEPRNTLLFAFGILLLSITVIATNVLYALLDTKYGIRFPLWLVGATPVIAVVILHAVIGVPVAQSRFGHLSFKELLVKQLLGGLVFLPPSVILTETAIVYIGLAVIRMDPFPNLFPSWGIAFLWFHALISIFIGVPCAVGLYWLYRRIKPYFVSRNTA